MEIKLKHLKCKKCGYEWLPRKKKVFVCPKCKKYTWNEGPEEEQKDE